VKTLPRKNTLAYNQLFTGKGARRWGARKKKLRKEVEGTTAYPSRRALPEKNHGTEQLTFRERSKKINRKGNETENVENRDDSKVGHKGKKKGRVF